MKEATNKEYGTGIRKWDINTIVDSKVSIPMINDEIQNCPYMSKKDKKLWGFILSGKVRETQIIKDKDEVYEVKFMALLNRRVKCKTAYNRMHDHIAYKDFEFETDFIEIIFCWFDKKLDIAYIDEVYNTNSKKVEKARKKFGKINFVIIDY